MSVFHRFTFSALLYSFLPLFLVVAVSGISLQAQTPPEKQDIGYILANTLFQIQDSAKRQITPQQTIYNATLLRNFYLQRGYAPVWVSGQNLAPNTAEFIQCFKYICQSNGLNPARYHISAILNTAEIFKNAPTTVSPDEITIFELLLTDAYMQLGNHLQTGAVVPTEVDMVWKPMRTPFDMSLHLLQALRTNDSYCNALTALEPKQPEYKELKYLLQLYEQLPNWDIIKAPWNVLLQKGDINPMVLEVRKRLQITGDLNPQSPLTDVFDKELEAAVMLFQRRHGLYYDGVVKINTINELNVSRQNRIEQIRANLERYRWYPDNWGTTYVSINIPEYRLKMTENNQLSYNESIIVGRENFPTPSFADTITYLVLNPYWYMPASIAKAELMSEVEYDANYFINNDITVFQGNKRINPATVNWKTADLNKYYFRQGASAFNPMGVVKFMFPNQYDIYLHDTPSRELFSNSRRSYSHGCVRINQPLEFAKHLLQSDPLWNDAKIKSTIHSQKETIVNLKKPIPIYLLYQTAFIDAESGEVNFREDLYSWDKKINQILFPLG